MSRSPHRHRRKPRRKGKQLPMSYSCRGGARPGAGRPRDPSAGIPHTTRAALASRYPVHVSARVRADIWRLRKMRSYRAIRRGLARGRDRFGFRVCEFSIQGNHLHFLCEAKDAEVLSRGMQGLLIRIARALNGVMGRTGKVFADRYYAHILKTPTEVKNALRYVFENFTKHEAWRGIPKDWIDPMSSAPWFWLWRDARRWKRVARVRDGPEVFGELGQPITRSRTWLLVQGWKRARP